MTSDPEIDPSANRLDQESSISERTLPVLATTLAQAFSALNQHDQNLLRRHLASQHDVENPLSITDAERSRVRDIIAQLKLTALEQGPSAETADSPTLLVEPTALAEPTAEQRSTSSE